MDLSESCKIADMLYRLDENQYKECTYFYIVAKYEILWGEEGRCTKLEKETLKADRKRIQQTEYCNRHFG
jgi:hypothetical protein